MNDWKDFLNRALRTEVPKAPAPLPTVPPTREQITPEWLLARGMDYGKLPSDEVVRLKEKIGRLEADLIGANTVLKQVKAERDELLKQPARPETLADAHRIHQQEMEEIRRGKRYDDRDLWVIPE